jgi:hypothetical protein
VGYVSGRKVWNYWEGGAISLHSSAETFIDWHFGHCSLSLLFFPQIATFLKLVLFVLSGDRIKHGTLLSWTSWQDSSWSLVKETSFREGSSAHSSWIQIQMPGFDSWRYQIFWEIVGQERVPLSLMSTIEELLGIKNCGVWVLCTSLSIFIYHLA